MDANNIPTPELFELEKSGCKINITFSIEDSIAISLPKAPYAGINIRGQLKQSSLEFLIHELKNILANKNIDEAIIRQQPPFEKLKEQNLLHAALINQGFTYSKEVNQHIQLNTGFLNNIHPMERRKIKKCMETSLIFKKVDPKDMPELHAFLSSCRKQQGLTINISEYNLVQLFHKLPSCYECYAVWNEQQELMAATIIVIVNESLVYNYLPAFDRKFKSFSPLSFLNVQLFDLLVSRNYRTLDLGISSINETLQEGLYKYKKRMGAEDSSRFNYRMKYK